MNGMEYVVKRSARTRSMRLAIYPDGAVVVSAPPFFGLGAIERFVAKHSRWIHQKVQETKGRNVIRIRRGDIPQLKRRALALCRERAHSFAALYGVSFRKLSIRAQK